MILISYINARGEEIILDDTEHSFLGELYGREGFEAPPLKYTEVVYGDGSTDIMVVNAQPRDVTLNFWARTGTADLHSKLDVVKLKLIQTGARTGSWGRLKVWQPEIGAYKVLNCVYIGGMYDAIRNYPTHIKFSLTFRANDPLLYNDYVTEYVIQAYDAEGYLMMKPLVFSGDEYDFAEDNSTSNPDALFMHDLTFSGGTYNFAEDNSAANPDGTYMKSAAYDTEDELVHASQKIYPTIEIFGPSKNIRVSNDLTGRKLEFSNTVTLDNGDYILIETKPLQRKCVRVNGVTGAETSILNSLTADSSLDFYIERGTNTIHYRNSEATGGSGVRFIYTEGYMGI